MKAVLVTLCCVFLALHAIPAQKGKVVVVDSASKDLKRTAYRMRIPVERLRNARQALQEATDLAKRARPVQVSSFAQLGASWILWHRAKAESAIKELVSTLRFAALDAREPRDYTEATSAARSLLASLAQLDPDEALLLVRRWPEPGKFLGEVAQKTRTEMESQFRRAAVQRVAFSNPDAALKLRSDIQGTGYADFGARAQIADSLVRAGRKDQAVSLLSQAIADLRDAKPNAVELSESIQLVQAVSRIAPERFPEAFRILTESAASLPVAGSPSLKLGDQVILLENVEAVALNLLAELTQRPALVMKAIDTLPNLKSKLEVVGGIDSVFAGGTVEIGYGNHGELQSMTHYGSDASYGDQSLYLELRGKAARDPVSVRERLSQLSPSPEKIQNVLNLAWVSAVEDPDLSSIALETAGRLIARIEPISGRAPMFAQMVRTSRRCDGEVDPEILKQGFLLVADIREEEEDQAKGMAGTARRSSAEMLERALITELAIDNYEAAIRYVRTMPDKQAQLSTLLAIVEACRRPF
ncbi:MAG: hypothetical protein HXY20_05100 [Acidobacteria bacterium]|nr:hypothetical protein [Acidobacteriota bacterium]